MRPRIFVVLSFLSFALAACTNPIEPTLLPQGGYTAFGKKIKPIPAMALTCLERTRSAIAALGTDGPLTAEQANMLLNRVDNFIKHVQWERERPATNVTDSYDQEVQKLVESGQITAEQASSISLSFECIVPVSLATGESHSCVMLSDNTVWCWGNNANGQLGNGSTSNSSVPVKIAGLAASQIDAGGFNTCALTPASQPHCWGRNEWGQLGNGSTTASSLPVAVSWPVSDSVVQLSVGWGLACGRTVGGEVYCWGQNSSGGVGNPTTTDFCSGQFCAKSPIRISTARTYKDVDVGIMGGCALDADGLAYCWGSRGFGALGDNVPVARCTIAGVLRSQCASEPTLVAGGNQFRSIQFGAQYVCAIRTDDQVMCWGANDAGQLGIGALEPFNAFSPMSVAGGQTFASITAVDASGLMAHACGVSAAGDASCWGWNDVGQLGAPNKDCTINGVASPCATSPSAVTGFQFKQVSVGRTHSCGLTTDDRVLCWGGNSLGQLGDGSTTAHPAPAPVTASWSDTP